MCFHGSLATVRCKLSGTRGRWSLAYVSADVRVGKSTAAGQPSLTDTVPSRPNEVWHMDTIGHTKTTSVHGYRYNTSFTCGYSGYVLSYGHASPSQLPEIQERWYADIARCRELHGEPRVFRCDNASVNVSRRATSGHCGTPVTHCRMRPTRPGSWLPSLRITA